MAQGLNAELELVLVWRWLPRPALALDQALPLRRSNRPGLWRAREQNPAQWDVYRFSFAQLAKQTPDLHFYRLLQLFNTPLRTLSTRDAGRSSYAYWQGKPQDVSDDHRIAHFWFFEDQSDQDLVVLEYGFNGDLVLRSSLKAQSLLDERFEAICARVNADV